MTSSSEPPGMTQARDIVTFGHETGRALADGTIIGRAEPFAKVFPSSRQVKRAVGVMAWAILEDIALDARLDTEGRLVADTNIRRIAANLGVSKNTIAKHLNRLRDYGFVLHEEGRPDPTGRYTTSRYVLDPSACVERFTHTPSPTKTRAATSPQPDPNKPGDPATTDPTGPHGPQTEANPDRAHGPAPVPADHDGHLDPESPNRPESAVQASFSPCTNSWDTDPTSVSQSVGHRELGHRSKEVELVVLEEQQHAREEPMETGDPAVLLPKMGISASRATKLANEHPPARIRDVVDAASAARVTNVAGWVIAALNENWDIQEPAAEARRQRDVQVHARARQAQRQRTEQAEREHAEQQRQRSQGWTDVAANVLTEPQLRHVVRLVQDPRFPASNRSARVTSARVIAWVAAACAAQPDLKPDQAVAQAVADPHGIEPFLPLPSPPATPAPSTTLEETISKLLQRGRDMDAGQVPADGGAATPKPRVLAGTESGRP